jgi:hypothetical protein
MNTIDDPCNINTTAPDAQGAAIGLESLSNKPYLLARTLF